MLNSRGGHSPKGGNRAAGAMEAAAILLVVLFTVAVFHEIFLTFLNHEAQHNHETCPLCTLIHTPVLLAVCVLAIGSLLAVCLAHEAGAELWVASPRPYHSAPRAPPLP